MPSFSTVVTSDVPIVSERAMYWPGDDTPFGEGHASSGLTSTALDWALAEGRVGGPYAYTTYILLANPRARAANVTVTFLRESGAPIVKTYTVESDQPRFNIDVGGDGAGTAERIVRRAHRGDQQRADRRRAIDVLERGRPILVGRHERARER